MGREKDRKLADGAKPFPSEERAVKSGDRRARRDTKERSATRLTCFNGSRFRSRFRQFLATSFEEPISNDLIWVYEGQTQYWGHVLSARVGLWSTDMALPALTQLAAPYDVRPGGLWRTMADTTRDTLIVSRDPLPWQ